ncbi:Uncharacterised protein [Pantoea agglomerans]|uniref:Bacterial Alpha-2-macroglobulin MG5 domain-containing protein n=1 Tax=Enterobacter agglomerans TaxID=549 RepID=A0A379AD41_ENTAG|nr:Uncharacterised protein [Pantoea agglomerans]
MTALPGYQFGDITEEGLKRTLDEVDLKLDASGKAQLTVENQWDQLHSPLNLILQASLLETGGRPVTRRATQAIWPAEALAGYPAAVLVTRRFMTTAVTAITMKPTVPEQSLAEFDIVYANSQGQKTGGREAGCSPDP